MDHHLQNQDMGRVVAVQRILNDSCRAQGVVKSFEVPEGAGGDDVGEVEGSDGFVSEDTEGGGSE